MEAYPLIYSMYKASTRNMKYDQTSSDTKHLEQIITV